MKENGRRTLFAAAVALGATMVVWWAPSAMEKSRFVQGLRELELGPLDYSVPGSLRSAYKRDGVILMRNLIEGPELDKLIASTSAEAKKRSLFDLLVRTYSKVSFGVWRRDLTFTRLAMASELPTIAAKLMGETKSVRLLKDAVFSFRQGEAGCGWHVDDGFFWPAEDGSDGVTFWISLSNLTVSEGGGLAVAKGSAGGRWARDCRAVVLSGDTCNMANKSPECWQRMEEHKQEFDMRPGDALVWSRYSFHRAVPMIEAAMAAEGPKLRYSVLYVPSGAVPGPLAHESAREKGSFESPLYPQVWPTTLPEEMAELREGRHYSVDQVTFDQLFQLAWYRAKQAAKRAVGREV